MQSLPMIPSLDKATFDSKDMNNPSKITHSVGLIEASQREQIKIRLKPRKQPLHLHLKQAPLLHSAKGLEDAPVDGDGALVFDESDASAENSFHTPTSCYIHRNETSIHLPLAPLVSDPALAFPSFKTRTSTNFNLKPRPKPRLCPAKERVAPVLIQEDLTIHGKELVVPGVGLATPNYYSPPSG
eukprot:CAMPEP_0183735608 /NCGR_PEP_ID=MMETSP0737-20130205/47175_1 /TAXON_ID=385413 /ORGANISM="Thalassiosira miniscula, Strain CCMP1093" /LENGTH=184 /DNA_ID=CAMNT_0025969409 /DNA_START=65 /DNA_END=619 /DNA_ORIENTATION=-